MKVLFIGDIVGRPGRRVLARMLPGLRRELSVDFTIANGENSAGGFGITAKARAYLVPLIKGEAPPPFKDGLPRYVRLKNVAVPKKLATRFDV